MALGLSISGRRAACTLWFGLSVVVSLSIHWTAQAHEFTPPLRAMPTDVALRASGFASDLTFPDVATSKGDLATPHMMVVKPDGDGPFPALVMVHQCAGLNPAVAKWAHDAVDAGYVVLLIDSLKPRGLRSVCFGPRAGVNLFRGARDAFQAADHLRKLAYVDTAQISYVGFSWGAMVGLIASSARYTEALGGTPFKSIVSLYPGCFRVSRPNAPVFDIVSDDMVQPVLVLIGETDNETPPDECVAKFQSARDAGSLVDWHVYPETGHCWDCKHIDGFKKIDVRGNEIHYRYRPDIAADSLARVLEFLKGDRAAASKP